MKPLAGNYTADGTQAAADQGARCRLAAGQRGHARPGAGPKQATRQGTRSRALAASRQTERGAEKNNQ